MAKIKHTRSLDQDHPRLKPFLASRSLCPGISSEGPQLSA